MATSGTRNFIQTRDSICISALIKAHMLEIGVTPSAIQLANAVFGLNSFVQSLKTLGDGIFLWEITPLTQVLTALNYPNTYILPKEYLELRDFFVTVNGTDEPITPFTSEDYNSQALKSQITDWPMNVWIQYLIGQTVITFYPIADQAYTVSFNAIQKLQDFTNPNDNPDFPVRWSNALIYGLAVQLSSDIGLPIQEKQSLQQEAAYWLQNAIADARETSDLRIMPRRR